MTAHDRGPAPQRARPAGWPARTPQHEREAAAPERDAVIAVGGNLGDREATIRAAVAALNETDAIRVRDVSPLVETIALRPGGLDPDAPRYLNGVVRVRTALEPDALLAALHRIETELGRVRDERWGDRTIDLDIITIDGVTRGDAALTLPHPRAHERRFVLEPWARLDPDAELPGHGRIAELLAALPADESLVGPR